VLRQIPEFEKPAPTSNSPCVSPGNGDNAGTGGAYHPAGDLLLPSDGPARRTSGPLRGIRVNPRHLLATGRPEPEGQPQPRITDGRDSNPSEVNEMTHAVVIQVKVDPNSDIEHRHSILNDFVIPEAKALPGFQCLAWREVYAEVIR
jgi:hypothetical protein